MEKTGITITKRKDGRYVGKFIAEYADNGKAQYHYVYGKTYEEAESKVLIGREIATRYLSGRYITVSKVYREWLNAVVNRVKESTLANYQNKFEKHILPEFGDIPCADLTAGRINAFINKKLADGLSASYVRDIFTVFKTMLKYAQEEYGFRLSLKNVVLPKAERNQVEKISDTEQKKLVSYLNSTPKSATSFREIAIPDMLMKYFEMFCDEAGHFILSGTDKPVEPRTMQYRYKKILQSAEVESHNYHKLRHTFATNSAEKGFNVKALSAVLGHSSVTLTLNRYIHPDRTYERRLMNMCMQL